MRPGKITNENFVVRRVWYFGKTVSFNEPQVGEFQDEITPQVRAIIAKTPGRLSHPKTAGTFWGQTN